MTARCNDMGPLGARCALDVGHPVTKEHRGRMRRGDDRGHLVGWGGPALPPKLDAGRLEEVARCNDLTLAEAAEAVEEAGLEPCGGCGWWYVGAPGERCEECVSDGA